MGHQAADVWEYTPRRIAGYLYFARRRQKFEAAQSLSIGAMAARGDEKELKKRLKEWSKE